MAQHPVDTDDITTRIVEAAATVFRQHGIAQTRMGDIADRSGVQRPNLYRYFSSKEDLLREVLVRETNRMHAQRLKSLALVGPVGPLLVDSLVRGQQMSREDEIMRFAVSTENLDLTAGLVHTDRALFTVEREYWEPLITHGRARGEIRPDLGTDEIVRWFFLSQFMLLSRRDFFPTLDDVSAHLRRFVVPAVLTNPTSA